MKNIFTSVANHSIPGNTFDLSHDVKLSCAFGVLNPVLVLECLPGDNYDISGNAMVRLAPTIAPVMHRCDVYMHYFFVPNRLTWPNWEKFITGGRLGTDATVPPSLRVDTAVDTPIGSIGDYMGLPTDDDVGTLQHDVNALPFAAYQKIYDDYFRDQNLTADINPILTDGPNIAQIAMLNNQRIRAWGHDYFTSALPWTQRGPEAMLPLGTTAPLEWFENSGTDVRQSLRDEATPHAITTAAPGTNIEVGSNDALWETAGAGVFLDVTDSTRVDLSAATASSIIDIRRAFALQSWLEKNATGGARYIEVLNIHFGVQSSDARLQRAEYIGGFSAPIKMSEVLQTSNNATDTTPQGNMAGHGISIGGSKKYSKRCEEHGFIIGILSVIPKTAYQQGVHKMWNRPDKLDYAWPSFAHIGEQPIENKELYLDTIAPTGTWGYTPRYAEYKFQNSRVAGDYRKSLDFWHMGRKWASLPPLNEAFIEMDATEVNRIFAVTATEQNLWCQIIHNIKAHRKLPVFGTPKI